MRSTDRSKDESGVNCLAHRRIRGTGRATARCSAFTLVEVMIVVAIVGLLAVIAIPGLRKAREQSIRSSCLNNLRLMAAAKDQAAINNNWPADAGPSTLGNPYYKDTCSTYLKKDARPLCPTGANCFYNALTDPPTCQSGIASHVLPE
jgi:prepilin-type N-terminal cleavage/methylation domain-containing protein